MYALSDAGALPVDQDFTELYTTHYRRVFSLCRYLLNSSDAAEDATHEVFLKVRRSFSTYDQSLALSSWLAGIAGNHCIDILRRRQTEARIFRFAEPEIFEPESHDISPLTEILAVERSKKVRAALQSLPDKDRVPLVLTFYSEFNYDRIASLLGISRNQVATLIFRGKKELRRKLQGDCK